MKVVIVLGVWAFCLLFMWALFKAGAEADRRIEEMMREKDE